MRSDNLYHKRKAKAADRLGSRQARRSPYDKVLIICEGEKTEPNYFNELIASYGLNTVNVDIDGSCGSSPKSVLERAIDLLEIEERRGAGGIHLTKCVVFSTKILTNCYLKIARKIFF
jgi:hypothetical protein